MKFKVTESSNIYICYDKIEYRDFIKQTNLDFDKSNNVMLWSADGKTIDNLVVIEWIE